jgi:integrase
VDHNHSYLYLRKSTYYYSRRVPSDMLEQYTSRRIVLSLRTRSRRVALRGAQQISIQLENHWSSIRIDLITRKLAKRTSYERLQVGFEGCGYNLSDARDLYLRLKGEGKSDTFYRVAERNIAYVSDIIGDKDLNEYSSTDGAIFRDAMIARGLAISSVKRIFSSVRSILNLIIREHGLQVTNPFSSTYMPEGTGLKKRPAISIESIREVQNLCRSLDDDLRWLIALVSDTGMRLGEACGLRVNDIVLDDPIPHLHIRPNSARGLKTNSSTRVIPLVGEALWGAQQAISASKTEYLFPRYTKKEKANANSASATLNKWLRKHTPKGCVIHSFRHSMRDRLRAIECPRDIVDQIGGWSVGSIGEGYGIGYPLSVLSKWMNGIN